jgi:hypothetical protein
VPEGTAQGVPGASADAGPKQTLRASIGISVVDHLEGSYTSASLAARNGVAHASYSRCPTVCGDPPQKNGCWPDFPLTDLCSGHKYAAVNAGAVRVETIDRWSGIDTALFLGPGDLPRVAARSTLSPSRVLFFQRGGDGTWQSETVSDSANPHVESYSPFGTLWSGTDSVGTPRVAWLKDLDDPSDPYQELRLAVRDGQRWETSSAGYFPKLPAAVAAFDPSGGLHRAWVNRITPQRGSENETCEILYEQHDAKQGPQVAISVGGPSAWYCTAEMAALAIDPSGQIHLLAEVGEGSGPYQWPVHDLVYATNKSGTWRTEVLSPHFPSLVPPPEERMPGLVSLRSVLAVDREGGAHVALTVGMRPASGKSVLEELGVLVGNNATTSGQWTFVELGDRDVAGAIAIAVEAPRGPEQVAYFGQSTFKIATTQIYR